MKTATALLVLALLVLGGVWFWKLRSAEAPAFQTVVIARGSLTQTVTATGTLNPVLNVQVGSQISGNIQKLFADFNSKVKAGQVVAQIDPAVFQASVTEAEGEVAAARAALELAQANAKRTQTLAAKQDTAQADVDQAMASLHQAEATVKIKQGALDKARVDLDHCTITSPVDGIVISRSVDVGQTVAASLSAPIIFQIANDLTKMQIDANVAEADVGTVAVDQKVEFTVDAFPYRTFQGRVKQVRNAPITLQNVVTYDTVIEVSNPDSLLKPGMTANVSVIIAHRDDVLKISNAALRFRMPETAASTPVAKPTPSSGTRTPGAGRGERRPEKTVYTLADGGRDPRPVQIKIGISDGVATEVLDGLKEGEQAVTASTVVTPAAPTAASNPFGGGPRRY